MKGKIGVTTENIFPVIKQFLYSDHEIFLRELVANAVDATSKLKALASSGEWKGELGDLSVKVELDEKAKTLKITDRGIGMNAEEVDKYINQIAFSSAGEFLAKYKDQANGIIGHFGLGFYSAFMVSTKVTIESLSYRDDSKGVFWSCDGSPEFEMGECKKKDRGTTITLYLDSDSDEFAHKERIKELLEKYCKFMPIPIEFDSKVINSVEPLWTKAPSELKDEDYINFYHALYPYEEDPMFYIHLNVDYPFTLTGILYFPKIKERMAINKNKIQLYCNQMFVTDHVDNIVPDFLTLLHGVIDSPDIPLNVSRSYLQSDANVKKISTYITKKVADRLEDIFKNQRETYEQKWDNIKLFIEYGMLSDEKFCERAMDFALLKDTDEKYYSIEEYKKFIEGNQKDKDGKLVFLYATNTEEQYPSIKAVKDLGYNVLLMDCELDSHFVGLLEQKIEGSRFARVDSDSASNLIPKQDEVKPEMSEDDKKALSELFKSVLPSGAEWDVEPANLGENAEPVLITQNEFMRRYRDMSSIGGGMNFYGSMPQMYTLKVNMENPVITRIWADKDNTKDTLHQVVDLALLSKGLLKGKDLAEFIARSSELLKK